MLGSKGLSLPGSKGEVIRVWWYVKNGRYCAYTELRGVYFSLNPKRYKIGVKLRVLATEQSRQEGVFSRYAGPIYANGYIDPMYVDGWINWGGVDKYVTLGPS